MGAAPGLAGDTGGLMAARLALGHSSEQLLRFPQNTWPVLGRSPEPRSIKVSVWVTGTGQPAPDGRERAGALALAGGLADPWPCWGVALASAPWGFHTQPPLKLNSWHSNGVLAMVPRCPLESEWVIMVTAAGMDGAASSVADTTLSALGALACLISTWVVTGSFWNTDAETNV